MRQGSDRLIHQPLTGGRWEGPPGLTAGCLNNLFLYPGELFEPCGDAALLVNRLTDSVAAPTQRLISWPTGWLLLFFNSSSVWRRAVVSRCWSQAFSSAYHLPTTSLSVQLHHNPRRAQHERQIEGPYNGAVDFVVIKETMAAVVNHADERLLLLFVLSLDGCDERAKLLRVLLSSRGSHNRHAQSAGVHVVDLLGKRKKNAVSNTSIGFCE